VFGGPVLASVFDARGAPPRFSARGSSHSSSSSSSSGHGSSADVDEDGFPVIEVRRPLRPFWQRFD
jgi:hypothetical protein